jgi:hypothetical protein
MNSGDSSNEMDLKARERGVSNDDYRRDKMKVAK